MHGKVYHVFSRKLYGQIGREDLRNRRDHEFEYVQKRIGILDFVLSHPECQYLETEPEKVSYFCNQLGVLTHFLPAKIYYGQKTSQPTVRYFVDKFPMFLDSNTSSSSPVVTFTYLQGSEANFKLVCLVRADMTGTIHVLNPSQSLSHDQTFYDREAQRQSADLLRVEVPGVTNHHHHLENSVTAGRGEIVATGGGSGSLSLMRFSDPGTTVHAGDTVDALFDGHIAREFDDFDVDATMESCRVAQRREDQSTAATIG